MAIVVSTAPPGLPGGAPVGTVLDPSGRPAITLHGNGDTLGLNDLSCSYLEGLQGFDMPDYDLSSSAPGGWDGELLEQTRMAVRDVWVPIHLSAATTEALRAVKTRLARLLDPSAGDVTVEVGQRDGTVRRAVGRYAGGFSSTLTDDQGLLWQDLGVLVRCFDPAWFGPESVAATFQAAGTTPFFNTPFFPLHIVASQALGNATVFNPGDGVAWPVVTITGPGSDVTVAAGGRSWGIDGSIGAAETLTVDTRRGLQTVEDQLGVSQWSRVAVGSDLWPLTPGQNDLAVTISDATAATSVSVAFTPRYLTAW